jgi:formamidopyrimidine-DNA glycosylase
VPELPDVSVYCERLDALTAGRQLLGVRLASPFLLRTHTPPLASVQGLRVQRVYRQAKRIVWELEGERFLVVHLMVAGRLHRAAAGARIPARGGVAAFDVEGVTITFTEVSKKKRASLHVLEGRAAVAALDAGGVDGRTAGFEAVRAALAERHTLKRSLTDPRLFDGIGGAYADEILFEAGLSPTAWSDRLDDAAVERLIEAMRSVLDGWTERLRAEVGDGFPERVTAFRPEMHVHGRYGQTCRRCGAPILRIVHGERETNYCPTCQTGGKVLADRALSTLLKKDWPENLEELAALKRW